MVGTRRGGHWATFMTYPDNNVVNVAAPVDTAGPDT